ncbi:hypothetical protein MOX02_57520 [Methylobacterium oxalidis]|uniref:Uncharacterized protein n=1 Tax=Methylobacterium oxalidis TaxID=944322 RepID=A0A512JCL2_9HYPH|nr:hypothetical protein MOX02_57520 [Methylobacterium oxalidis]GLS62260.1 hypothetical protein GCM10007888_06410 [Methylobacterium oxalidis]
MGADMNVIPPIVASLLTLAASAAYVSLRYSEQEALLESISGALFIAGLAVLGGSLPLFR